MKLILLALVLLLGGCTITTRTDIVCVTTPMGEKLITNCADVETWREFVKQGGEI